MNVIFAVTKYKLELYDKLSHYIEGSVTGELMEDSSNVVDLVKNNYDVSIVFRIRLQNLFIEFWKQVSN